MDPIGVSYAKLGSDMDSIHSFAFLAGLPCISINWM